MIPYTFVSYGSIRANNLTCELTGFVLMGIVEYNQLTNHYVLTVEDYYGVESFSCKSIAFAKWLFARLDNDVEQGLYKLAI